VAGWAVVKLAYFLEVLQMTFWILIALQGLLLAGCAHFRTVSSLDDCLHNVNEHARMTALFAKDATTAELERATRTEQCRMVWGSR
jgi:hypothetical protein